MRYVTGELSNFFSAKLGLLAQPDIHGVKFKAKIYDPPHSDKLDVFSFKQPSLSLAFVTKEMESSAN